jgi:hypothetical protein
MSDHKLVQCFGTKRRPHKQDKPCRRRFMWTARAGGKHQFGRKGTQACPHCGTLPDLGHPFNRYLNGEISEEEAQAMMPAYTEKIKNAGQ